MSYIKKSFYIILVATIFMLSLESAAMMKSAAKIAPFRISHHIAQMPRYHGMRAAPRLLENRHVNEFYALLDQPNNKMIGSDDIKALLEKPTEDNLLEIFFRATILGNKEVAEQALKSSFRLGFNVNNLIESDRLSKGGISMYYLAKRDRVHSILEFCLDNERLAVAEMLLRDFNANPNVIASADSEFGYQPLWAKYIEKPEIIELLVKYGVDNLYTDGGKSLLICLFERATKGSEHSEKYLILLRSFDRNGCNLNNPEILFIIKNKDFFENNGLLNILKSASIKRENGDKNLLRQRKELERE